MAKSIKAKDLVFHKVESGPAFTCSACGHRYTNSQWRIADIPIHNGKDMASIAVCSKACQKFFVAHPDADDHVRDLVERTEKMPVHKPSAEELSQIESTLKQALGNVFGGALQIKVNR